MVMKFEDQTTRHSVGQEGCSNVSAISPAFLYKVAVDGKTPEFGNRII